MTDNIHIRFHHGLGDCSNFAHMIPLYTRRGHRVTIDCTADKAALFRAAGAEVATGAKQSHDWAHATVRGTETVLDHWNGNKSAFNVSRYPLPSIGTTESLWGEYLSTTVNMASVVTPEVEAEVAEELRRWQQPVICLHTKGNTSGESKNLSDEQTLILYRELLDRTDGTILLLDWDNRVPKVASHRVRHLTDDWKRIGIEALYVVLRQSALFIGIDSGPFHFVRTTNTPAIGLWTHHHPARFALPRRNTLNIVSSEFRELNRLRRLAYNIVESPGGRQLSGQFIAEQAVALLEPSRYLSDIDRARDVQLRQFVGWTRSSNGHLSGVVDRDRSFDKALRFLKTVDSPIIVETGCIRAVEDWGGAGFATYLFARAVESQGGQLHSVELDESNVAFARKWTAGIDGVAIHQAHSHDWLRQYDGQIDLFYSDSADVGTPGYESCCLEEVKLALPKLRDERSRILIDDTCWSKGQWTGKGHLAVPWLLNNGWSVEYAGYQVLLKRRD